MPPRRQPSRQTQAASSQRDPEVIAKRTKRHLDELERSNYTEPSGSTLLPGFEEEDEAPGGRAAKGRARQTISDKKEWKGMKKKKPTMSVRSAVLYKKNLQVLIDESGIANLPPSVPTYLTAGAPPSREPPRLLCSVCGYWGKYRCKKCTMPYCGLNCEAVHDETRCERRVI